MRSTKTPLSSLVFVGLFPAFLFVIANTSMLVLPLCAFAEDSGVTKIRSASMGGFLDHVGGSTPGTDREAETGDSSRWEWTKIHTDKGDALILRNVKTRMYMDVDVNAGKPSMEARPAGKGQQWVMVSKDGKIALMNVHTGTYLFANSSGKLGLAREVDGECLWEFR